MAGVNEKEEIKYTILENEAFNLNYHSIEYLFYNTELWGSLDDELKRKFESIIAKHQLISTSSKGFDGFKFEDKDLFDDVIRVKNGGENLFGFVFRQNGKAYIFLEEYAGAQNSHNVSSKEQINARMLKLRNWTYQENDPNRKKILDAIGKEEQIKKEQRERAEKENLKKNDTNNFANVIDIKHLFKEESKKNDVSISTNSGQEAPENQSDDFKEIEKLYEDIKNAQYKIKTLLSKKSEWNKKLIEFSKKTEKDLGVSLISSPIAQAMLLYIKAIMDIHDQLKINYTKNFIDEYNKIIETEIKNQNVNVFENLKIIGQDIGNLIQQTNDILEKENVFISNETNTLQEKMTASLECLANYIIQQKQRLVTASETLKKKQLVTESKTVTKITGLFDDLREIIKTYYRNFNKINAFMMTLCVFPGSISKEMILADIEKKYGNFNFNWQKERLNQNQIEIKNIDTEIKEIKYITENKEKKLENFKNKIPKEDTNNNKRISEIIADIRERSNEIERTENSNSIQKIKDLYENLSPDSIELIHNTHDLIINRFEKASYLKQLTERWKIENSVSEKEKLEEAIKKTTLDVERYNTAFNEIPNNAKKFKERQEKKSDSTKSEEIPVAPKKNAVKPEADLNPNVNNRLTITSETKILNRTTINQNLR